ncbi:O-antigen ligase family protein [Lysobacter sp. CA199]|uniref:O-antigen ligase family protein n=1 Tax=Lysobacter sp. CA199 TaxID=3455608 RepID=UPI003F8D15F0
MRVPSPKLFLAPACLGLFLLSAWASVFFAVDTDLVQYTAIAATIVLGGLSLSYSGVSRFLYLLPIAVTLIVFAQIAYLNSDLARHPKELKFYLILVFCAYCACFVMRGKAADNFVKIYVALCFILSIAALGFNKGAETDAQRLMQGDGNPIWIARAAGTAIMYLAYRLLTQPRHRAVRAGLLLPCVAALVLAGSRGPIVSLVIGLGVLLVLTNRGALLLSSKVWAAGVAMVLLGVAGAILAPAGVRDRMASLFVSNYSGSDVLRMNLYEVSFAMLRDTLFGKGFGAFEASGALQPYPHNLLIESLIEPGLVFTVFFFALIGYAIRRLYKSAKLGQGRDMVPTFLCALAVYSLANAMFSGDITSPKELYLCVFFAMSTALTVKPAVRASPPLRARPRLSDPL